MANRGFENFDFSSSAQWLSYYENIYPPPNYSQLTKIKQKWYKEHIDKNYNPNANAPNPNASNSSVPPRPQPNRSSNSEVPPSPLQLFQVALFSLSVPAMLYGKTLHLIIAGHVAGLIHYHNLPRMNLEYWRPVIADDNMHSIVFALLFLILPASNLWMVPAYTGVLVYIPEVVLKLQYAPQRLKDAAKKLETNKIRLLQTRADSEVWVGFALIFIWITGMGHWINPIIYWQYTRMRYILNYFSKITFTNIRVKGDQFFSTRPGLSVAWEKLKSFCNWLCTIDSNQPAGSSCEIF